jgi:hypothetical protein
MDSLIRQRLLLAEEELLSAILEGDEAIERFAANWMNLQNDIENALPLDDDILQIAYATASRVAQLADTFLEVGVKANNLTSNLKTELEEILGSVDLSTTSVIGASASSPISSPKTTIVPALEWLMKNLHNPYPPSKTKQSLAQQAGKSVDSINRWFMNARSRIGWTDISKNHFHGSRNDTIDGAHRAFFDDDPKHPLPSKVVFAFMKMKVDAETLYLDKIKPSRLAMQIDAVVDTTTARLDDGKAFVIEDGKERQAEEKEQRQPQLTENGGHQKAEKKRPSASYPSPARSLAGSPEPSVVDENDNDGDSPSSSDAEGRKRRFPTSSESLTAAQHSEGCTDRPIKRRRYDSN